MSDGLEKLERTGALRILVALVDRGPLYVTKIIGKGFDDLGIATQNAVQLTRRALEELALIEEYEEDVVLTHTRRRYLRLTPKGRRVAEHVHKIAEILSET